MLCEEQRAVFRCRSMAERDTSPKVSLNVIQLLGVLFVAVIGGAYGMEDCIRTGGGLWTMICIIALPWIWGLPTALCVAELGTSCPANSGPDAWISAAFPTPVAAMTIMWTFFINRVDNSVYPNLFVDYLNQIVTINETFWLEPLIKIAFVFVCCVINIIGIDIVGKASTLLMIVCIAPFIILFIAEAPQLDTSLVFSKPLDGVSWTAFLPMISWNLSGFDSAGHIVEEVKSSGTTLIKSLLMLLVLTQIVYGLPIIAGLSLQARKLNGSRDFTQWTDGYWVTVADWYANWIGYFMSVGGLASATGFMCSLLCTTSRALQGHAMLGLFPKRINNILKYLHPKYQTPVYAIVVNSLLCVGLSLALDFDVLVNIDSVLYSFRLIAIILSFYVLRIRHPSLRRGFLVPCTSSFVSLTIFVTVPIVFCLVCIVFGIVSDVKVFAVSVGLVGFSVIGSYFIAKYHLTEGLDATIVYETHTITEDDKDIDDPTSDACQSDDSSLLT